VGTLDSLLDKYRGDLNELMKKFEATGAGKSFRSWVGTGENEPITADQVKQAFGRDLDELASKIGMGKDEAADEISKKLPDAVDKATPDGSIPSAEEVKKSFSEQTS
jgi:uncharacterized protein YidB (DUF937 family)